jgi:predicted transposase YbfD/YdcC
VKDNQPTLKADILAIWETESLPPAQAEQVTKHADRVEERRLWVSDALVGYSDWPHLGQVCRIEYVRTQNDTQTSNVTYKVTNLSSKEASPRRLLSLSRGHWGIENGLHWVRDVTFDEDRCQIRTDAAPQVMAALRNTVIGLVHLAGSRKVAEAQRRFAARPFDAISLLQRRFPYKH